MVSRNTYSFTTAEVQAKQAELQAQHRKQRLIQVRRQEKQHAELQRQKYKENCQELAGLEQASFGRAWQRSSKLALTELQQQLGASLAKTGQGQKAADAANQSAAVLAAQRTAERQAQLQVAKQRFAQALQLKHLEQSTTVAADVTRLQRVSDTIAAESARAHALAQHHRAIQAEATTNSNLPAATNWSERALRAIDYNHTRLHELGVPVPSTVMVERNNDRGKAQCTKAAHTAVREQARMAQQEARCNQVAADQRATATARGEAAAQRNKLHLNAQRAHAQLAAAQHAQRAQQIKGLKANQPAPLGMRCDDACAQQQLQRRFEAQFLHKTQDLKAKLRHQLQQQQQQSHRQAADNEPPLHWTTCMPAARQHRQPLGHSPGPVQARVDAIGELGPRKAVPVPTARQPLRAASRVGQLRGSAVGSHQRGSPTRIQLPVPQQRQSHEGPSAEEQLAWELQEAMAEARSHQRMAAQHGHTDRQIRFSQGALFSEDMGEGPGQLHPSGSDAFKHKAGRLSVPSSTSSADCASESPHAESATAEASEEELLQWQPGVPTKKQPSKFGAKCKQGTNTNSPPSAPADTALPASAKMQLPHAADSLPSFNNLLTSVTSVPATSVLTTGGMPVDSLPSSSSLPSNLSATRVPATDIIMPLTTSSSSKAARVPAFLPMSVAMPSTGLMASAAVEAVATPQSLQIQAVPAMDMSSIHRSSSASLPGSSAMVSGPMDHKLSTISSASSLSHALHAGHAVLPQLAGPMDHKLSTVSSVSSLSHVLHAGPALLPQQSAPHGFPLPPTSPTAAAAALTASTESNLPSVHSPESRQSISSWSSQASDILTLRHSIAFNPSVQCADSSSTQDAGHPVVTDAPVHRRMVSPDLQWHLLDTKELQAQTAALLSSLTSSTDYTTTDAAPHRQTTPVGQLNQSVTDAHVHSAPSNWTLSQSVESELQSTTLTTACLAEPGCAEMTGGSLVGETASSSFSTAASRSVSGGSNSKRRVSGRGRASGGHSPASSVSVSGQLPSGRFAASQESFPVKVQLSDSLSASAVRPCTAAQTDLPCTYPTTADGTSSVPGADPSQLQGGTTLRAREGAQLLSPWQQDSTALLADPVSEGRLAQSPLGRIGSRRRSCASGSTSQPSSSSSPQDDIPVSVSDFQEIGPSSSSLPQDSSGGYQGLAALAGNLAASLPDMLGPETDDVTLVTEDGAHETQQAQHSMCGAHAQQTQQGHQALQAQQGDQIQQGQHAQQTQQDHQAQQGDTTQQGIQAQQEQHAQQAQHEQGDGSLKAISPATLSLELTAEAEVTANDGAAADQRSFDRAPSNSPAEVGAASNGLLEHHASALAQRLHEKAAAATALSEAATAPSSIVSGLTDLYAPPVRPPVPVPAVPQLAKDSTDLHARAAAAIAALEAASAASSTVSGLTQLQNHPAHYSTAAETVLSSVSGLTEAAAAAAADRALSEVAGAASSTVSGVTELVAAGASLVDIAAALPTAAAAHPFGLSSAHSVDGYALVNALSAPSSVVSNMTELLAHQPVALARAHSVTPHESDMHSTAADRVSR